MRQILRAASHIMGSWQCLFVTVFHTEHFNIFFSEIYLDFDILGIDAIIMLQTMAIGGKILGTSEGALS